MVRAEEEVCVLRGPSTVHVDEEHDGGDGQPHDEHDEDVEEQHPDHPHVFVESHLFVVGEGRVTCGIDNLMKGQFLRNPHAIRCSHMGDVGCGHPATPGLQ